jgi:hypothetical protein
MKKVLIGAALVSAAILSPPIANAGGAVQGAQCQSWHATATDSYGNTLYCTHTPDSGHLMYWELSVMDR